MSVFDTSAVLAIFYDEDGRDVAEARLQGGVISTVNVAEVVGDIMISGRGDAPTAVRWVKRLGLEAIPPTIEHAERAAEWKRVRGLSLGDRFCISLGEARNERLVTGDQQWGRIAADIRVPVEMIR